MTREQQLESWAMKEMPELIGRTIIQLDKHSLLAFGRYHISRVNHRYVVDTGSSTQEFGSSKSAISWCILDLNHRPDLCIHLSQLDERRTRLTQDINAREQVINRSSSTRFRDAALDKLERKRHTLTELTHQLDKYASRAKYLQLQGFANETARTRRP